MHGRLDADVYKDHGEPIQFHVENAKLGISAEANTLRQAVVLYANALKRMNVEKLEEAIRWSGGDIE